MKFLRAVFMLVLVVVLLTTGCASLRPSSSTDGKNNWLPLDSFTPKDSLICEANGESVSFNRYKYASLRKTQQELCPEPEPTSEAELESEADTSDDSTPINWEFHKVESSQQVELWAYVEAQHHLGTWETPPELALLCETKQGVKPTSNLRPRDFAPISVSLRWVIERHPLAGDWSGWYQFAFKEPLAEPVNVRWFASIFEAEALWLLKPDSASFVEALKRLTSDPETRDIVANDAKPQLTVDVAGTQVVFDLSGWETALPILDDCADGRFS